MILKPGIIPEKLIAQDYIMISKKIEHFISSYVSKNSVKGVIVGLSGGLDSSVVLKLAADALGPAKVLGLVMPSDTTPKEDTKHAIMLAQALKVKYHAIDISSMIEKYTEFLPSDKRARGNLTARIRMNILYYYAGVNNHIVLGTSDKSEIMIGYFTKFGDGAADLLPIADLYKTQVRALAKQLQIPSEIIGKKSSPRLWNNHLAEEEIGMNYETIDSILFLLVEKKMGPAAVAKKLEISINKVRKIKEMIDSSSHKRDMPKIRFIR